jgi:hypothetical protein
VRVIRFAGKRGRIGPEKEAWSPDATEEERSLRLFKDALMRHAAIVVPALLSAESAEELRRAIAEVEHAYARVREHVPDELEGSADPTYAEVLTALRDKSRGLRTSLPSRRVLVHMLADLDYYFFTMPRREYVYDMPQLTDEERAAENGLRHDLLLKLYDELEPAFDVSLSWPPGGYEVDENGRLIEADAEFAGMAAVGYDYGYDAGIFYEGNADDKEFVRGFVEGYLDRIEEEEPDEVGFLRNLWEGGDEEDRGYVLEMLKAECEVREGRFDERPEFPA